MKFLRWLIVLAAVACDTKGGGTASADSAANTDTGAQSPAAATQEPEPTQWTLREVTRRLTDGGLVVTDSGRAPIRQSFLAAEGHQLRVSGSDLQVFIYANPRARKTDSDRIDTARVAPPNMIIDWVATPHLIASGNLLAIHLTPNDRLAERVRLILEAWHAEP